MINLYEPKRYPIIANRQNKATWQGTCFMVNADGYLLTNHHVVEDASSIEVYGVLGDLFEAVPAIVVAQDVALDLALLKLEVDSLHFDSIPYTLNATRQATGTNAFVMGFPWPAQWATK